jgi:hypothetical protein
VEVEDDPTAKWPANRKSGSHGVTAPRKWTNATTSYIM